MSRCVLDNPSTMALFVCLPNSHALTNDVEFDLGVRKQSETLANGERDGDLTFGCETHQ